MVNKENQVVHSSVEVLRVQKLSELNNPVVMAKGIHLFPSRTQQLSPYTSKVLGWKRPGRIDSCRLEKQNPYQKVWVLFFYMIQLSIQAGFLGKATPDLSRAQRSEKSRRWSFRIACDWIGSMRSVIDSCRSSFMSRLKIDIAAEAHL